jgi:hypothetical protein
LVESSDPIVVESANDDSSVVSVVEESLNLVESSKNPESVIYLSGGNEESSDPIVVESANKEEESTDEETKPLVESSDPIVVESANDDSSVVSVVEESLNLVESSKNPESVIYLSGGNEESSDPIVVESTDEETKPLVESSNKPKPVMYLSGRTSLTLEEKERYSEYTVILAKQPFVKNFESIIDLSDPVLEEEFTTKKELLDPIVVESANDDSSVVSVVEESLNLVESSKNPESVIYLSGGNEESSDPIVVESANKEEESTDEETKPLVESSNKPKPIMYLSGRTSLTLEEKERYSEYTVILAKQPFVKFTKKKSSDPIVVESANKEEESTDEETKPSVESSKNPESIIDLSGGNEESSDPIVVESSNKEEKSTDEESKSSNQDDSSVESSNKPKPVMYISEHQNLSLEEKEQIADELFKTPGEESILSEVSMFWIRQPSFGKWTKPIEICPWETSIPIIKKSESYKAMMELRAKQENLRMEEAKIPRAYSVFKKKKITPNEADILTEQLLKKAHEKLSELGTVTIIKPELDKDGRRKF